MRRDHPFAAYGDLSFRVPVFTTGDVKARTLVRVEEARESVRLIREAVASDAERAADGSARPPPGLRARLGHGRGLARGHHSLGHGRRGGPLYRVKIMDPSFLNWRPLSYALLKNIVPDFPLCNKSFNQSYSGNDL